MNNHYIISIIDAFKLYNTLRGTDLITPQDFLKGCENLSRINSKIKHIKLKNEVQILCFSEFDKMHHYEKMIKPYLS